MADESLVLRFLVLFLLLLYASDAGGEEDRCFCELTGKVEDCCCTVETVDIHNNKIQPIIASLVKRNYFRYYRVNLKKACPFWPDDSKCGVKDCSVDVCKEDDVPPGLKGELLNNMYSKEANSINDEDLYGQCSNPLGDINTTISDEQRHGFDDWQEYDETEENFCDIEDETSKGLDYVDLLLNAERYTGYKGFSANRVWRSIYKENCFDEDKKNKGNKYLALKAKYLNKMCLEKRSFYRLISGMHASINIHLSFKYLLSGNTFGKAVWGPKLSEFRKRFDPATTNGEGPVWLKNLYFTYLLVLRAVIKAGPYWEKETFYTGDEIEDTMTKQHVLDLIKASKQCPSTFDETQLFSGDGRRAKLLKEEFRRHFKNITKIMDCVGCDKCRLWGKLQTTGIGTALKILFSSPNWDEVPTVRGRKFKLSRIEITSLFNALERFSLSIQLLKKFRQMKS